MENILPLIGSFSFNPLDIAAFIVFIFCLYTGSRKGLVRMLFGLVSGLVSFYVTYAFYPIVSVFLKDNTNIYSLLKKMVVESLSVGEIIAEYIQLGEDAVISNLSLPQSILSMVTSSNIPSVYNILNVATLEDYISSFLANMLLNVICWVAVFALVSLAMRLIITALDLIAKLPVIRKFNRLGGALAGAFTGFILIWAIVNLYCLLLAAGPADELIVTTSISGKFIYEHNLLFKGFTHVFN